jgi:ethanolamine kinase
LQGGITNRLYAFADSTKEGKNILVRIYGDNTELFIDRDADNQIFSQLSALNFGVHLLGTFVNGRVEEFLPCTTCRIEDFSDHLTSRLIAHQLSKMHCQPVVGSREPVLWSKLNQWIKIASELVFIDITKREKYNALNIPQIKAEIGKLKVLLDETPSPIVFAHNDLLNGNILKPANDNTRVVFVDMEYGGYNYRGFDIGNHFCEFAGFDFAKIWTCYPNKAAQYNFFEAYLQASRDGARVEDHELDRMYIEVNRFALAAHLFWGTWAVIQGRYSKINFDYLYYARLRFEAYFTFKERLGL